VVLAGSAYLILAVVVWWGVWSTHPSTTTTCGCGDAARFLWFFQWPAYALAHGHDVLFSTWLFHPGGINLLDDTSVVALGVLLAPVTWLFGPVTSMNVALTLAPTLSALAMFVLLRRWVRWTPAAFFAGLAYGFAPFMVTELALNQLNIAFLAVPPLVVLVLSDLLVTQRRPPWRNGLALAGLMVVQFFVSTEVLVITVVAALVGIVLLVVGTAVSDPGSLRGRTGPALRGAAVAVGTSVVVLAYPLWFLLDGPAHLVGPIWSAGATARFGTTWSSFVTTGGLAGLRPAMLQFGGYQGPVLVGLGYLGAGVLAVAVVGAVAWHRDRRLLLFGGVGLIAAVLSLGPGHGSWVPWTALQHVPWIGDIVEVRFTLVVTLCVAVMAGLALDHLHHQLARHVARDGTRAGGSGGVPAHRPRGDNDPDGDPRGRSGSTASWAGAVGVVVGIAMLIPSLAALAPNVPLAARQVVLPTWYSARGATLPPGRVVLAYPVPFSGLQSAQAWQAVNAMAWAQAGGGGPQGQPSRAGAARPGFEVLFHASLPLGPEPQATAANVTAVRRAMALWRVTTVVVPDQPDLPAYEQGRSATYAVGLLTAVLGVAPDYQDDAWVWSAGSGTLATTTPAPHPVSAADLARCTAPGSDPMAVPRCVLAAPGTSAPPAGSGA